VIKVCPSCASTWAGGTHCEDCGAELRDPYAPDARERLPQGVWKYIRLQYGARRGMIVRVLAFLSVPVVFGLLARAAIVQPSPWHALGLVGAALAAAASWATLYWIAGKAVRLWVLRRGQLNRRKLARALARRMLSSGE
jgi:hypothetical protein